MKKKKDQNHQNNSKVIFYAMIGALVITSLAFEFLNKQKLEQTSLLFVGIPAFLSILIVKYTGKYTNVYFLVFKIITLFLLISFMFLGEGMICILMMSPLFYLIGALCAFIINLFRKHDKSKLNSFVLLPILFVVGQGYEINQAPQVNRIETRAVVDGHKNWEAFNEHPNFMKDLPGFLTIGFPKPTTNSGGGLNVGDIREINFKSTTKGDGILALKIASITNNNIVFLPVTDETHIDHWLSWKEIHVELKPKTDTTTEVVWTTYYTCDLGPSWYFRTIENYAVDLMNGHLINAYFNVSNHVD